MVSLDSIIEENEMACSINCSKEVIVSARKKGFLFNVHSIALFKMQLLCVAVYGFCQYAVMPLQKLLERVSDGEL